MLASKALRLPVSEPPITFENNASLEAKATRPRITVVYHPQEARGCVLQYFFSLPHLSFSKGPSNQCQ